MSFLMNTIKSLDLEIHTAADAYLYSKDVSVGYLDMFCDSGTCPLGYLSIKSNIAINHLMSDAVFHIPNSVRSYPREVVAEILCNKTGMDKLFFCNSGTESIETAIKIVRKYNYDVHRRTTRDYNIYCYKGGFHGRTYGSLSASDGPIYHFEGFGPILEDFIHFDKLGDIHWPTCGGILMETIFGNNDVRMYDPDFLRALRAKCTEYDIPLVLDEIQCGAFRTGKLNAFPMYDSKDYGDFRPDILCMAKGIACGIPTGVCLAKGKYAEVLTPGTHFSTFAGSPFSALGIWYLLDSVGEEMQERIKWKGHEITTSMCGMKGVKEIRGTGFMMALELLEGKAIEVSQRLLKEHIFLPTFRSNIIKMAPPFILSDNEINTFLTKLNKVLNKVFR